MASFLAGADVDLPALERIARAFLPRVEPLLGVDLGSLRLSRGRSGASGGSLWLVDFDVLRDGRPIEGARVVFRVNNGNLVQLGSENLPAAGIPAPSERVTRKEALAILGAFVGGFDARDTFVDGGSLHLLPVALADNRFSEGFAPGKGRGLALVWQISFRRRGEMGTWRARIDATTGKLLELADTHLYGKVQGGVGSPAAGGEVELPMPFADLSTGDFADAAGRFNFSGAPVSSTLSGRYVGISDTCGPIAQNASAAGRISFGASVGTDCATPGFGGAGNTHAARTQFYHLNRIKQVARGWLPGNPWMDRQLLARVNFPGSCNAYWNGDDVVFLRSGDGCGNTGEIPEISLHEYGHGFDENDGSGPSPDPGTAESYADITAALTLRSSCIGRGFYSSNCNGYGDSCTACTGVRDIDWARHASNTPHTVANFTQLHCEPEQFGGGPCGGDGHCESYVVSEAIWDLAARDLPSPGSAAAWTVAERLWYLSRQTATSAFTCDTSTPTWTSNGCGTGSLWRVLRFADDDDGNLANGTPHSCHLFAAFDRHGLACASDAGANVCFSGCTPPAVPQVTVTPGVGEIGVSWTSAGSGVVYDVFKSELGCNAGFVKVADSVAGTSWIDMVVGDGITYSYQVIAHPAGSLACSAAPSTCESVAPTSPSCDLAAPEGATAMTRGLSSITVSWNAVAGATGYIVDRSTTSGGPYAEVGSTTAPATTWIDSGLQEGTTYHYTVRACSDCESGPSAEVQATTFACTPQTVYSNDFETGGDLADWTRGVFPGGAGTSDWQGIQTCDAHSGSRVFRFGGSSSCDAASGAGQYTFAQPRGVSGIAIPADALASRLSFRHRWNFEPGYDGGTLALSLDGSDYTFIPASAILSGATYNAQLASTCGLGENAGRAVFTGYQPDVFENTVVDLDAACHLASGTMDGCAGRTIWVAFVAVTDCIVSGPGWYLDDVTVSVCGPGHMDQEALDLYTLPPCRVIDTRGAAGPLGGPALQPQELRTFDPAGGCGIPATARALVLNLTVIQPAASGHVTLFPAGTSTPSTSTINFAAGQVRANNAVIPLDVDTGAFVAKNGSHGTVHVVVDVTGYFE